MEDIAIIGFSLRFPQDAVSPESFWKMLVEGRSAATEVPGSRFNIDAFYHPDPDRLGSVSAYMFIHSDPITTITDQLLRLDELPGRQFLDRGPGRL